MPKPTERAGRVVHAVHGLTEVKPDPDFELGLSAHLRDYYTSDARSDIYARFSVADSEFDALMRRVIWRAGARRFGNGVRIGPGVGFKHLETFECGDGVFIGAQSYLQGRFDGRFRIGNRVWIGPQSYFDARELVIEDDVGWGPGAKVLGSTHTAVPTDVPIIRTDLEILPVHIGARSDVGTNAVILPGVSLGEGCIVGAGAVVTHDVPPYAVVAGVPARFLKWREGFNPDEPRR